MVSNGARFDKSKTECCQSLECDAVFVEPRREANRVLTQIETIYF